nr:bacteriocin [uncultured Flavobacterium sp.]
MKPSKETAVKNKVKTIKVFKPLDKKQLETVVGGPITSRGTESVVQQGV